MSYELRVLASEEGVGAVKLGLLEINAPKSLGAVDTSMLEKIGEKLKAWQQRSDIACVVLYSKSDRAFCAGGDVKSLVQKFRESGARQIALDFFTTEYFVDYFIHVYPKPTVCIADGVTMGGGIGLMNGCKFRVVTERTLMAMPEISIGLFPDVGGGYFLNQVSHQIGQFLGLTGARFMAGDALKWGLADVFIESAKKQKLLVDLMRLNWSEDVKVNTELLQNYFGGAHLKESAPRGWQSVEDTLARLMESKDLETFEDELQNQTLDHHGFTESKALFLKGSPRSRRLIYSGLQRMRQMTLRAVFETEWNMAIESSQNSDFTEGVRALLIDKDQMPKWSEVKTPPESVVEPYFKDHEPHLLRKRLNEVFGKI